MANNVHVARELNEKQQAEFFEMLGDPLSLNSHTISALFAYHKNGGIKFYTDDIITIGPEQHSLVKPNSKTTLGLYIINKYIFEDLKIMGYINKTITGKLWGKIEDAVAKGLMEERITQDQACEFINRSQFLFGGPLAMVVNTSMSETLLRLPPKAKAQLKQELKTHKEELEANDPQAAAGVRNRVADTAMAELNATGDPAIGLITGDVGIDAYNNYATIFIMKGAVKDNTGESDTGYKVVTSNYDDGISKEDLPKIAEALVTSSYNSGVLTQDSGTNGKKYNAIYQSIRIMDRGSDCKTKDTITVEITSANAADYMYRYIVSGEKLIMLDTDNINNYIGKTVKMRTGIYCKAKHPYYCSKCVGDRPYRIGVKNIGLTFNIVSGSTLNASLKTKHDSTVKFHTVTTADLEKYMH